MKLQSFLDLTAGDLESMSMKELRAAAHSGFASLNKRVDRLQGGDNIARDAIDKVMREGGKFRQAGLNKDQLIDEIQRAQRFGGSKTSTIKGAEKVQQEREELGLGGRVSDLIREALAMWDNGEIGEWTESPKDIVDAVKHFVEENDDRNLGDYTDHEIVNMIFGVGEDPGESLGEWDLL